MVISILSQKGGVGKSTLARALAVEYARHEWIVKIADMDTRQQTCVLWNGVRSNNEHEPSIEVQGHRNVKEALRTSDKYDLIIFDGAGQADRQTLEIAQHSDMVILPTGISVDDLRPQTKLGHELVKNGISRKQIGMVLSRVGSSDRERVNAIEYIEESGYKYLGHIDEKTSIIQAQDIGKAAIETPYPTVNKTIDKVIQAIVDHIEELEQINA